MTEAIIGAEFSKKVIPLIDQAIKSISIIVFDWRWYPDDVGHPVQAFNNAIIRARRRGVDVRCITNMNDVIKVLKEQGIKCVKPATDKLIHPKIMIIDNETVIIGSHNYTQSAFTTNHEISVILNAPECMSQFLEFFNKLFANG